MKKFVSVLMGLVCLTGVTCCNLALAETNQKQTVTVNEPVSQIDKLFLAIRQTKDTEQLRKIYGALGYEYYRIDNYKQALKYFNEAEKIKGNSFLYKLKGDTFFNLKNYLNAVEYYTKAIDNVDNILSKEHISDALYYRSVSNCFLGNGKEAESDIKKILDNTDLNLVGIDLNEKLGYTLWYALMIQGKYEESINLIEKFLTQKNNSEIALITKADILWELKQYEKCKEIIEKLEQLNSTNYMINLLWAEYYLGIEDYKQALGYLNKVGKEYFDGNFYNIRAKILLSMGKLKEALADVNAAIQVAKSGYIYEYEIRGDVYAAMGKKSKAIADYKYFLSKSQNVVKNAEVQEKLKKLR